MVCLNAPMNGRINPTGTNAVFFTKPPFSSEDSESWPSDQLEEQAFDARARDTIGNEGCPNFPKAEA